MTLALIYARVSTDPQERDGSSLSTQEKRCRSYAKQQGWSVAGVVKDTASGYTLQRPGLTTLRGMLPEVDVVLAYDFDRLAREQTHMAVLLNDIIEAGCELHSATDGPFDNTAIGKFMLNARTFAAEVEREKIAERTMRGKLYWSAEGRYIGPAPYGYTKVYETVDGPDQRTRAGKIVTDEDQARVVRRIFDRYLAGDGHRTIAVRLTREKIPTPSKAKNRKNPAREWSSAMVRLILESEVYAGRGQWNGTEIPAPAIVDEETFASVQAERAKRSRYPSGNSSADNILTGVLYCSECGSRMQGDRTTVRKNGREYFYRTYICSRWHAGHGCVSNRHNADDLEARVLDDLELQTTVTPRKSQTDMLSRLRHDMAEVDRALARHAAESTNLLDQIAAGNLFGMAASKAVTRIEEGHERLSVEKRRLTDAIAEAEARARDVENRPQAIAALRDAGPAQRKAILARYAPKILVRPGDPEPHIVE